MSDEAAAIRLRQAFEMANLGFWLMRQTLRRRFPNATQTEIDQKFDEWLTSPPPMSGTDLKAIPVRRPRQKSSSAGVREPRRSP